MIKEIFWVGLGGGIGSILRYLTSKLVINKIGSFYFPLSTFTVNLIGCLLIGILVGLSSRNHILDHRMQLLLITGFCGGFTTFSTFSVENFQMYEAGNYLSLAFYILLSVIVLFIAVWAGMNLIK
jgi:CrcB protein